MGQTFGSASKEGGGVGDSALVTDEATNVAALVNTFEVAFRSPLDWGCGDLGPDPIFSQPNASGARPVIRSAGSYCSPLQVGGPVAGLRQARGSSAKQGGSYGRDLDIGHFSGALIHQRQFCTGLCNVSGTLRSPRGPLTVIYG